MFTAIRKIFLPGDSTLFVRVSHLLMVVALLGMNVKEKISSSNYLHTSGNQILDASGRVVGLSGVNWFGLETALHAPHGLWQRSWGDMLDQIKGLGYNVIRLPFSDDMLTPEVKPTGIDFQKNPDLVNLSALEVMDRIIAGARARGLRVILDNHRSTAGGGPESNGLWYTSSYAESRWIEDWKMLANRYKGDDTVIGMDLRNEPFGTCWGCGDPAKDWRLAAEKAGNAILSVNPDLLIIVEGVADYNGQSTWWGGNLMGAKDFPVRLQIPNRLVYSAHEYPSSMYAHPWFSDPSYPNNLPAVWDKYWGYLSANTPILIGEFGTRLQTDQDRQWFQKLGSYIQAKHLNWTFWAINPNSGDTGGLLLDDWQSVQQEKQNLLRTIQYPFLDAGGQGVPITTIPSLMPLPTNTPVPPMPTAFLLDDFESGRLQNWNSFRSDNSNIVANVVSPGQVGNYTMKVDYGVGWGGWAGVENIFSSPQNWSPFQRVSFGFNGTNSGATIRFEILDNGGNSADTAERFEYKFTDNFNGWRTFDLPWNAFARRLDWQPMGAPNDGFGRATIWGFNISPVNGAGSFQVDDIKLISP